MNLFAGIFLVIAMAGNCGPTERWTIFRPHPEQQRLYTSPKRFRLVAAGRGSGKTELAKRFLVRALAVIKPWPDARYFFGAPTRPQAKRIAWRDLKALTPQSWFDGEPSESELCISTRWGAELYVVGLDAPERVQGLQWDGCILDESSDLKPGIFDTIVQPALTHRTGWCWRIGIPRRYGIGIEEFRKAYDRAKSGTDPEADAFWWKSEDILTQKALKEMRERIDPVDYREQFEASFETAGGRVFHAFSEDENVRPCPYNPQQRLIIGSDFNVDPMAWVIGHAYPNRLEWFDEIFLRNANTQKALDTLWQRYSSHQGGFAFYGDATARARKSATHDSDYRQIWNDARFQTAGRDVFYPHNNPAVQDRLASCNAMFCNAAGQRRMFVDPRLIHLKDDVKARHFRPSTTELQDTGDLGHITDAMGYAVHWLFPIPLTIEQPKSRIIIQTQGAFAHAGAPTLW